MLETLKTELIIGFISTGILTAIQLIYSNKNKPVARKNRTYSTYEISKFNRYEAFTLLPLFVIVLIVAYGTFLLGIEAQNDIYTDKNQLIILPSPYLFAFVGLFFGFGFAPFLLTLLFKNMLRDDYEHFNTYMAKKHNWDGQKFLVHLSTFLLVSGPILFFMALNYYLAIDNTGRKLIIKDFFAYKAKENLINEITSITRYSHKYTLNGKLMDGEHFVIGFKDGYQWTSVYLTNNDNIAFAGKFITYLASESKVNVNQRKAPLE